MKRMPGFCKSGYGSGCVSAPLWPCADIAAGPLLRHLPLPGIGGGLPYDWAKPVFIEGVHGW